MVGWLLLATLFSQRVLDVLPCSECHFDLEHEYQNLLEMSFALQVKGPNGQSHLPLINIVNKSVFSSSGPRSFPGKGETMCLFFNSDIVNPLLQANGG